jgi:hypothetical protein
MHGLKFQLDLCPLEALDLPELLVFGGGLFGRQFRVEDIPIFALSYIKQVMLFL